MNIDSIKYVLEDIETTLNEVKEEESMLSMLKTLDDLSLELDKIVDMNNIDHEEILDKIDNLHNILNDELGFLYADENFDDYDEEDYDEWDDQ